jgi:hypothetical protein
MDQNQLTKDQLIPLHRTLFPSVNLLNRLERRMSRLGFKPNDALVTWLSSRRSRQPRICTWPCITWPVAAASESHRPNEPPAGWKRTVPVAAYSPADGPAEQIGSFHRPPWRRLAHHQPGARHGRQAKRIMELTSWSRDNSTTMARRRSGFQADSPGESGTDGRGQVFSGQPVRCSLKSLYHITIPIGHAMMR